MDEGAEKIHPLQQLEGKARERFNMVMMGLCLTICFITGGGAGWLGHWLLNPPTFSEAQQSLVSMGYSDAAAHLGEIEKVCPNGTQTKIACRLVLMDSDAISRKSRSQVAQANINVPTEGE